MAMLVIFSMFVLTDLYPIPEKNPSVMEYMVIAWAVTTLTEEIRQVCDKIIYFERLTK